MSESLWFVLAVAMIRDITTWFIGLYDILFIADFWGNFYLIRGNVKKLAYQLFKFDWNQKKKTILKIGKIFVLIDFLYSISKLFPCLISLICPLYHISLYQTAQRTFWFSRLFWWMGLWLLQGKSFFLKRLNLFNFHFRVNWNVWWWIKISMLWSQMF